MAKAKVEILVSLNGTDVWGVAADLDPLRVRHITDEEADLIREAIPKLIDSIVKEREPEPIPARKKK
jgi:hypothetical protein